MAKASWLLPSRGLVSNRQSSQLAESSIQEQLPRKNVKRFRGGLGLEVHRLVYHSTLGWRVIKKKKRLDPAPPGPCARARTCVVWLQQTREAASERALLLPTRLLCMHPHGGCVCTGTPSDTICTRLVHPGPALARAPAFGVWCLGFSTWQKCEAVLRRARI